MERHSFRVVSGDPYFSQCISIMNKLAYAVVNFKTKEFKGLRAMFSKLSEL